MLCLNVSANEKQHLEILLFPAEPQRLSEQLLCMPIVFRALPENEISPAGGYFFYKTFYYIILDT